MDKPPAPDAPGHALPGHRVLELSGRDALAFAQAQCMNDVSNLADGQWQWNGWLTPKGRVVALFALLRLDAATAWLLLPDADPHALAEQWRRYVFRSRVMLAPRDDLAVAGGWCAPAQADGNRMSGDAEAGIELDFGGHGGPRALRIGGTRMPDDPAADMRWRMFDLMHGWPRLHAAQSAQWTPQQLSLDRLRAYSVKKGCYPGQEIVARTHFLGQAKRGLALFSAARAPDDGARIAAGGEAAGTVVCSAGSGASALALGVVALDRDPAAAWRLGDDAATRLPLQDGLAR